MKTCAVTVEVVALLVPAFSMQCHPNEAEYMQLNRSQACRHGQHDGNDIMDSTVP
jgi:hypothetical protein